MREKSVSTRSGQSGHVPKPERKHLVKRAYRQPEASKVARAVYSGESYDEPSGRIAEAGWETGEADTP
jgi:hypothetical protein